MAPYYVSYRCNPPAELRQTSGQTPRVVSRGALIEHVTPVGAKSIRTSPPRSWPKPRAIRRDPKRLYGHGLHGGERVFDAMIQLLKQKLPVFIGALALRNVERDHHGVLRPPVRAGHRCNIAVRPDDRAVGADIAFLDLERFPFTGQMAKGLKI